MNEGVAIFLVHFNGTLDEQGHNHAYIGGKTHLFTLPYTSGFDELIYTIHDRIGTMPNETRIGVKCQAPIGKFLKPIIIDIEDDKDFKAVLEMFKNSTISLGMLYVTKFKPIEDTQPTSTSMPSPSLCGDRTIYAVENVNTLNAPSSSPCSYNFIRSSPENPLRSPENPLRDYQTADAHFDGGAPRGHNTMGFTNYLMRQGCRMRVHYHNLVQAIIQNKEKHPCIELRFQMKTQSLQMWKLVRMC